MTKRVHVFSGGVQLAREIFDWGVTPDDGTMVALQCLLRRHPDLTLASFLDAAQVARVLTIRTRGRA
jgi:hypothetical protein